MEGNRLSFKDSGSFVKDSGSPFKDSQSLDWIDKKLEWILDVKVESFPGP